MLAIFTLLSITALEQTSDAKPNKEPHATPAEKKGLAKK